MTTYTYGLYNLISSTKSGLSILKDFFKMPIIYALIAGVLLNVLNVEIPQVFRIPLDHVTEGFIAIALITLGAQLSQIEVRTHGQQNNCLELYYSSCGGTSSCVTHYFCARP